MKYYNLYSINAYFRIWHLMRLDTKNQQKLQEKVRFDTISPSSHLVHVKGEQRLECLCSLEKAINCNSIYLFISVTAMRYPVTPHGFSQVVLANVKTAEYCKIRQNTTLQPHTVHRWHGCGYGEVCNSNCLLLMWVLLRFIISSLT